MGIAAGDLDIYHQSLERVLACKNFLDRFYASFIGSSEEVKAFFKNTEMAHQKRKLATTLRLITMAADDSPGADIYLEYLGRYHRDIHVPRHLYQEWLEALLSSAQACDPQFNPEVEQAWRTCIDIGIENMLKAYDEK